MRNASLTATAETPAIRLLAQLGDLPAADRAYVDDVGAHDGQRRRAS